jgi:hypothetical protein
MKVEDTMTLMFSKDKEQVANVIENDDTLNEGRHVNRDGKDSKLQSRLNTLKSANALSKEEKAAKEKEDKAKQESEDAKLLAQSGLVPIATDGAEDPDAAANFHKTVDGNMYRGASFNPLLWKQYLIRHHMYATLCWRCAHILGLNRTPTNSEASEDRNERKERMDMAAGQEFTKYDEDGNPIEGGEASAAPDAMDEMSEMSMSSDEEDDEAEIFPEWLEVQVSHTSRAMMLQWARWARWNLKIKEEEKVEARRAAMAKERAREEGAVDVTFLANMSTGGGAVGMSTGAGAARGTGRGGSQRSRKGASFASQPQDDMGINIDGEEDPDETPIDR